MLITFDPVKRQTTLEVRGLDFTDAELVFTGVTTDIVDDRHDYGEERMITVGTLIGRVVVIVWTPRGDARHVIPMRKANDREQRRFRELLG